MHSRKPELSHHQQSSLPQTSLVLSATGSLELRLVSSAIFLEHTNNNTSHSWLGLVIVSNDRRTIYAILPKRLVYEIVGHLPYSWEFRCKSYPKFIASNSTFFWPKICILLTLFLLKPGYWLCWGLMTCQPLWVILCCLPEKGRKEIEEIVEEMKERDRGERGTGMKVKISGM